MPSSSTATAGGLGLVAGPVPGLRVGDLGGRPRRTRRGRDVHRAVPRVVRDPGDAVRVHGDRRGRTPDAGLHRLGRSTWSRSGERPSPRRPHRRRRRRAGRRRRRAIGAGPDCAAAETRGDRGGRLGRPLGAVRGGDPDVLPVGRVDRVRDQRLTAVVRPSTDGRPSGPAWASGGVHVLDRRRAPRERCGPGRVPDAVAARPDDVLAAVRVDRDVGAVRVLGRGADQAVDRVGVVRDVDAGRAVDRPAPRRRASRSRRRSRSRRPPPRASLGSSPPVVMNGAPIGRGMGIAPCTEHRREDEVRDVRDAVLVERDGVAQAGVVQVIGDERNELLALAEVDLLPPGGCCRRPRSGLPRT